MFEYHVCIQRRRKRKEDFGDALGGFSWAVQHKDSWEQARSWKFSLVDDSFQPLSVVGALCFGFLCVHVCFWGCVWVGFSCFCFCSMPCFLLPSLSHITVLGELAPTDCVGDPGSNASSGQLKELNSVFLCPNHLATGQAGLILYLPPALPLGRNSILF